MAMSSTDWNMEEEEAYRQIMSLHVKEPPGALAA